jgi:ABC-type transport system involved in cytochrome c biogenesis permease subunit
MRQFSDAMQAFGDQIQPQREKLPIRHREPTLLRATAYPPAGFGRAEVFYNRLNPFFWAWVVSFVAIVCLSLSWGRQRNAMFWLGVGVLSITLALILIGFAIRMHVTGLIPLTGMFETVVFVALAVVILGLGFALWPLAQFGLSNAWNMTAFSRKKHDFDAKNAATSNKPVSPAMRWTWRVLRGMLTAVLFYLIVRWPGRVDGGIFDLLPQSALGTSAPSINDVLVWLGGICIVLILECYLPRCVLAFCIAFVTVPFAWIRHGVSEAMEDVMRRRFFVLGGAAMCCLAVMAACFAPATVMKRDLGAVAPILRDNHWLVVHVVTIMASYASAAIALVLGNIALGHYLFGSYRNASSQTAASDTATQNNAASDIAISAAATCDAVGFTGRRLPPEACATLAGFIYAAVRVTVLLLAAGTILGALWADKSWGRFWGWDPKEVWALISLLIYLLILHARAAGWAGDFGMAIAAVLGATAVLFTWYGVNFVLNSGMHAYGAGSGGHGWPVVAAVATNWLFLLAASVRYCLECGRGNSDEANSRDEDRTQNPPTNPPTSPLGKATSCILLLSILGINMSMASSAASQQLAVIEKMPDDLFQYTGGAKPNAQGMVADNRDGFKSPEFQRGAMHYMMRAIARGDAAAVNEAWPAIDATFAHQTEEGGLSRKGSPLGGPSALAIWLAELDQTMLVLRESKLEPQFHDRIEKLIPKIHRAARWLMQSKYQAYLLREDAQTPNRLLFDALAFGLSGVLTDDAELKQTGRRFVDAAVALFRSSDGVFLEKGGPDSSYQAVAALKLQVWLIYFPDPKLAAIADQAVGWELGRVQPDGQVEVTGNTRTGLGQEQWMGRTKGVNLSEVTLCLLYHFARTGAHASLDAARRIVDRRRE